MTVRVRSHWPVACWVLSLVVIAFSEVSAQDGGDRVIWDLYLGMKGDPVIGPDGEILVVNSPVIKVVHDHGTEAEITERIVLSGHNIADVVVGRDRIFVLTDSVVRADWSRFEVFLTAMDASGHEFWRVQLAPPTQEWIGTSPGWGPSAGLTSSGGIVVASAGDSSVYYISEGGEVRWRTHFSNYVYGVAGDSSGVVYVAGVDGLRAIDLSGNLMWYANTGGPIHKSIAIGPAGIHVLSGQGRSAFEAIGNLYTFSRDGRLLWTNPMEGALSVRSSPVVDSGGDIAFVEPAPPTGGFGVLRVVSKEGGDLARIPFNPIWFPEMILGTGGLSYVLGTEGTRVILHAFDLARAREEWRAEFKSGSFPRLNMGSDGTLYLVHRDYLYALRSSSDGLSGHWPKDGRDEHNSSLNGTVATAVSTRASARPQKSNVLLFPNPLNGSGSIRVSVAEKSQVEIRLYNIAGQMVENVFVGSLAPGVWELRLPVDGLATGAYLLATAIDDQGEVQAFTVIK